MIDISKTNVELSKKLLSLIQQSSMKSVSERGQFTISLSGGSLSTIMSLALDSVPQDTTKWQVFYSDERCVPLDHNDSNHLAFLSLFKALNLQPSQIHTINEALISDPSDAARDYESRFLSIVGSEGVMDVILLGLGPDGHTCSLFPNHALLKSTDFISSLTDSPKPPSSRITMTLKTLNRSRSNIFVATGKGKAEVLKDILEEGLDYPAKRVQSNVTWLLDTDAAHLLN